MRLRIAPAALLALLALTITPMLAGCMSKARQHLYTAEDLFEKRDLQGAKRELEEAVKLDPSLTDAHKSLAHVDEYVGDTEGAGHEYDIASQQDPTDQKLMNKARYYHAMKELANSADKALDDIKAGNTEDGLKTLKEILTQTKEKIAHDKAVAALTQAAPIITQQADDLQKQGKYQDAINHYAFALRTYILIAEATHKQTIDPAAEPAMNSLMAAAKAGNTPDRPFQILNEILTIDPDNKAANIDLAQVYLDKTPPDYGTAADLMERAGAPDADVAKLRKKEKHH